MSRKSGKKSGLHHRKPWFTRTISAASLLETVEEEGIVVIIIPSGTTDTLQSLDVSTNKDAKDLPRERFQQ